MKKALFFLFSGAVIITAAVLIYLYWEPGKTSDNNAMSTIGVVGPTVKGEDEIERARALLEEYFQRLADSRNRENPDQETDANRAAALKEQLVREIPARTALYLDLLAGEKERDRIRFLANNLAKYGGEKAFNGIVELFWKSPQGKKTMLLMAAGTMNEPGAAAFLEKVVDNEKDLYLRRQALSLVSRLRGREDEALSVLKKTRRPKRTWWSGYFPAGTPGYARRLSRRIRS